MKFNLLILASALALMACHHHETAASLPLTAPAERGPYVVKASEAPIHSLAGGKVLAQLFLNESNHSNLGALSVLTLQPGAAVPVHDHSHSAEILYILEGTMEMVIEGQTVSASAGDAVHIPVTVQHSAKVASDVPVKAVQIYVAPGPEQRFAKGPIVKPTQPEEGE